LDSYDGELVDWNEGVGLSGDGVDWELTVDRSLTGGEGMGSLGCAFRSCDSMNYDMRRMDEILTSLASVLKSPYLRETKMSGYLERRVRTMNSYY
jgi:hypothetical protein